MYISKAIDLASAQSANHIKHLYYKTHSPPRGASGEREFLDEKQTLFHYACPQVNE
jgi:hypothetical protein